MLGLESVVSIGKMASAAAPATLGRQNLNIYEISGGKTQTDGDDNILGGGLHNTSDPVAPAPGLDDHTLTIKVPLCINQFPWWCAAFFGTEVASGSASDYTHAWESGQALPYIFLEHKLKTGRYRRHIGLIGESMEIDLDAEREGYGQATFTFKGLNEVPNTVALTGTVTAAPDLVRPAQKVVNVAYNEVSGGDIIGGKFKYTRKLKRIRSADGTGVAYAVDLDGISTLEGGLHVRYNDDTFYSDSIAQTLRELSIELAMSATRKIVFDLPNQRLSLMPIDISGPDGVEQNWTLRAWQTTTEAALTTSVMNGVATVTFP